MTQPTCSSCGRIIADAWYSVCLGSGVTWHARGCPGNTTSHPAKDGTLLGTAAVHHDHQRDESNDAWRFPPSARGIEWLWERDL